MTADAEQKCVVVLKPKKTSAKAPRIASISSPVLSVFSDLKHKIGGLAALQSAQIPAAGGRSAGDMWCHSSRPQGAATSEPRIAAPIGGSTAAHWSTWRALVELGREKREGTLQGHPSSPNFPSRASCDVFLNGGICSTDARPTTTVKGQ